MGSEGRDSYSSARHRKGRNVHDLAALPSHLHLLLGVEVVLEDVDMWDKIEWQRMGEDLVLRDRSFGTVYNLLRSVPQLVHSFLSGTRGCLIGGHDDLLEAEPLVKRKQRHDADGGRAVRVCNNLVRILASSVSIDLWDAKSNILIITERRRVVNDNSPVIAAVIC